MKERQIHANKPKTQWLINVYTLESHQGFRTEHFLISPSASIIKLVNGFFASRFVWLALIRGRSPSLSFSGRSVLSGDLVLTCQTWCSFQMLLLFDCQYFSIKTCKSGGLSSGYFQRFFFYNFLFKWLMFCCVHLIRTRSAQIKGGNICWFGFAESHHCSVFFSAVHIFQGVCVCVRGPVRLSQLHRLQTIRSPTKCENTKNDVYQTKKVWKTAACTHAPVTSKWACTTHFFHASNITYNFSLGLLVLEAKKQIAGEEQKLK